MRHDAFDFAHRNYRQEPAEQAEQSKEQTETSNQHHDVNRGGMKMCPTGWEEVAAKRSDRDHVTLKPHTDIDENTDDHHEPRCRSAPLYPEQLGDHDITGNHREVSPRIPECPVDEGKRFDLHSRVPGNKKLNSISRTNHQAGGHNDFVHILQVPNRDQILQIEDHTTRNQQGHYHCKTTRRCRKRTKKFRT